MTDNEIIKAFECCCVVGECADCPCFSVEESDCKGFDWNAVYDLIKRQKAEIERLKEILGGTSKVLTETCAVVRAEAVNDFAENLKRNVTLNITNDGYLDYAIDYYCLIEDINDLVKEMVGEG